MGVDTYSNMFKAAPTAVIILVSRLVSSSLNEVTPTQQIAKLDRLLLQLRWGLDTGHWCSGRGHEWVLIARKGAGPRQRACFVAKEC